MTGICFNNVITDAEKQIIISLFKTFGEIIVVSEDRINAITAISGSGPAYFFLFVEAFINAAISLGFDNDTAKKLVKTTIDGALELLLKSNESPELLRQRVTSPGGTTEAAIKTFNNYMFADMFKAAVNAALNRANELAAIK